LKSAAAEDFPVLRQVVAARQHAGPDGGELEGHLEGQLEFSIDLVIAGLERLAARHG
jgi:hypothetical protein